MSANFITSARCSEFLPGQPQEALLNYPKMGWDSNPHCRAWCSRQGSNLRPLSYKESAPPIELLLLGGLKSPLSCTFHILGLSFLILGEWIFATNPAGAAGRIRTYVQAISSVPVLPLNYYCTLLVFPSCHSKSLSVYRSLHCHIIPYRMYASPHNLAAAH